MKIKFCGLKRKKDIKYVNKLKPDYVGFVFCKKSKRYVDLNTLIELCKDLDKDILKVGVFLSNTISEIKEVIDYIDIIQIHDDLDDSFYNELKSLNKPIIKAINVDKSIIDKRKYDYVLYDSKNPGSGKMFDWSIINDDLYFLAGGININNILDAIKLNPYCIDISSGIEKNGKKNYRLMKKIMKRVNKYGR